MKTHRGWWGERSYSLRLFHTTNLTGTWEEHPMSPITTDPRYARSGGRPLMYDGHVHRWAQVRVGAGSVPLELLHSCGSWDGTLF